MYQLSKPQQLIYNMEKYAGGAVAVICGSFLKKGKGLPSAMKRAVNELYRINPALRTCIVETVDGIMQKVSDFAERDVEILRFSSKTEFTAYANIQAKIPMDIYGESLCALCPVLLPERYGLFAKVHHIIGDAWSLSLLGRQFWEILEGRMPVAYAYEDYVRKETVYLHSERFAKDRAFFLEQFRACDEIICLSEQRAKSFASVRKTFVMNAEASREIREYADSRGISIFVLVMAVFAAYMNRVNMNVEKFYIGTAVLNRSGVHEKNTAGMFINTVPVFIELDNRKNFEENLSDVQKSVLAAFRHSKYNYGTVLADLRKNCGFTEQLYDVALSYQNATISNDNEAESIWHHNGMQMESLQIHIDDRDMRGVLNISYDYQTEKFTAAQIDSLHEHLCSLLFDAIENDGKKLYELELLTADEKQKLLYDFNDTAADYPRDKCVHTVFEERAARTPDKTAVIACDRTLTYRELNEHANRIAHSLMEKGVGVGDIIAFALTRKSYLIAAMFGILKAGAAYLPIDMDYPQERIDYMMADSGVKFCITEENVAELLANEHRHNPHPAVSGENLCYCVYTSGTTGKPKGALVTHGNISHYVCNDTMRQNIKSGSRIVSISNSSFDIFFTESLWILANHGEVLLANEEQSRSQFALNVLLQMCPANILQATPTKMWSLVVDSSKIEYLKPMKAIFLGGEILDSSLINELRKITDADIYNSYGPTETTILATNAKITFANEITIGKPIANTQIYIVDKYLRPVPLGVTGELCIAGDGVGAGYLNRPELTAEKFIDNSFGEGKLYRTGDLAYWREDGNIAYVGRNDFQVKIRGLRIELGEIENAIAALEGVSQAEAVVRKDDSGRQLICAFYTGAEFPPKEIRDIIGQKLPKYMLPHIFTHLEKMPLTSSGKVNRKALPEVDLHQAVGSSEYSTPEGATEEKLAVLMEKVLRYSPLGRDDDFFDLGCDSLQAIEFAAKAHEEKIPLDVQEIFDHPSVRQLAAWLQHRHEEPTSFSTQDFEAIHAMLRNNTKPPLMPPPYASMGNLLLTGSTGYLGAHLLREFLACENGNVYCIVRGNSAEESETRLRETWSYYFGNMTFDGCRVHIVKGDLTQKHFGLSAQQHEKLDGEINTVIHAAANVKHYGNYSEFQKTNVESVKRLIDFCMNINARLVHISTTSVAGQGTKYAHFDESCFYIGQELDNVYVRSKFEAEKVVFEAMLQGLRGAVMRIGNLANRYEDGFFQRNYETNMFLRHVKAFMDIGAFPDDISNMPIDITPVDEAATAIMTLVRHFDESRTVFHVANTNALHMGDFLALLGKASSPIQCVSRSAFAKALQTDMKSADVLSTDFDKNGNLRYNRGIALDNRFTNQYLKKLGFVWSKIGIEYLQKYVKWMCEIGYL